MAQCPRPSPASPKLRWTGTGRDSGTENLNAARPRGTKAPGQHCPRVGSRGLREGRAQTRLVLQSNDVVNRRPVLWRYGLRPGSVSQGVARQPRQRWAAQNGERFNKKLKAASKRPRDGSPRWRRVRKPPSPPQPRDTARARFPMARAQPSAGRKRKHLGPDSPAPRPESAPCCTHGASQAEEPPAWSAGPRHFPCSAPPSAPASASATRPGVPGPRLLPVPPRRHLGIVQHSRLGGVRLEAQHFLP